MSQGITLSSIWTSGHLSYQESTHDRAEFPLANQIEGRNLTVLALARSKQKQNNHTLLTSSDNHTRTRHGSLTT
jgi:hypothetical protein